MKLEIYLIKRPIGKKIIFATHKNGLINIPNLKNNKYLLSMINSVEEIPGPHMQYLNLKMEKKYGLTI